MSAFYPDRVKEVVESKLTSSDPIEKYIATFSIQYLVFKRFSYLLNFSSLLKNLVPLMHEKDWALRKAVFSSLNAIACNIPKCLVTEDKELTSKFYINFKENLKFSEENVQTLDLGQFKHRVDNSLNTRLAAFSLLETLSESCKDIADFDTSLFVDGIKLGLSKFLHSQSLFTFSY